MSSSTCSSDASECVSGNLLLLYDDGDEVVQAWGGHMDELFQAHSFTVDHNDINTCVDEVYVSHHKYNVIVIILSPDSIDILSTSSAKWQRCLSNHGRVVALPLGLTNEDIDSKIKPHIACSQDWPCFELTPTLEHEDKAIEEIKRRCKRPVGAKPRTSSRPKSHDVRCFPDCVRKHHETILLVFKEPVVEGQIIQVSMDSSIDGKKVDTRRLNQYNFTFKAPDHTPGKVTAYILKDGNKWLRFILRYEAPATTAYTNPLFLCQMLGLEDEKVLDQYLASIYDTSVPHDKALHNMLTPKNILANTGEMKSSDELPTLLHFACRYGLEDLCTAIVEFTPGVQHVFDITNCKDKTPIDLAEDNGHSDIVNYLESYHELVSYASNLTELYEKMGMQPPGAAEDYIKMGSGYIDGRFPSQDEQDLEGYEIRNPAGRNDSQVPEVNPEDDVTDDSPVVPPRLPRIPVRSPSPEPEPRPRVLPRCPVPDPDVTGPPQRNIQQMDSARFLQEPEPKLPGSMGSSTLEYLSRLQLAFKDGDLTQDDVAAFFENWKEQSRSSGSASMKERQRELQKIKDKNAMVMEKVKPKGFFSRFSKKKPDKPNLDIRHHVTPNAYDHWQGSIGGRFTGRESTISTTSTSSSSSSGSRDSALDPVREQSSDSEDEMSRSFHHVPPPREFTRLPSVTSPHGHPPALPNRPKKSRLPNPPKQLNVETSNKPPVPPPRK